MDLQLARENRNKQVTFMYLKSKQNLFIKIMRIKILISVKMFIVIDFSELLVRYLIQFKNTFNLAFNILEVSLKDNLN